MKEVASWKIRAIHQMPQATVAPNDLKLFMDRALDVDFMLQIFQREFPAWTTTPIRVIECRARAGKTSVALKQRVRQVTYEVCVELAGAQKCRYDLLGVLPVTPAFLNHELLECCHAAQGHPAVMPFQQLAAYIPELQMGVQFSPVDLALPALIEATQPAGGQLVVPYLPECQNGATLQQTHVGLLHYKPGTRCVLKFTLQLCDTAGNRQQRVVFAKLFADDRGAAIYRDMQTLWDISCRSGALRMPQPLGYDSARRMLVMAEALGERDLNVWIKCLEAEQPLPPGSNLSRLERCMTIVAKALRELHCSGIRPRESRTFQETLADAYEDLALVRSGHPRQTRDIERVLALLQTRVPHNERLVPCHGGFRHKQLVGNDQYLTLIDWDGLILAHPALDAASFLCRLRYEPIMQPGKAKELGWLAEVFRREFLAHEPEILPHELARYEALVLMNLTLRALRHPERRERVALHTHCLAAEAEHLLNVQNNLV